MPAVLTVPSPDLRALATGESVIAVVARGSVSEGDELDLAADDSRNADELKPAYRRWAAEKAPAGAWSAVVAAVHPAQAFDDAAASSRHIFSGHLEGDVVVLRMYGADGPVLSDAAFDARVSSLEGSLRP